MNFDYNDENTQEKALLIGVDTGEYDAEASMDELAELAKTAGAFVQARIMQKRDAPNGVSFVGKGCLEQAAEFCGANDTDIIIADSELTPVQVRNIEDETDVRVIDRTTLILDIFASRARSKEGKLQTELAQLKYSLPRLTGKGSSMSRLGGGIGTRGPGETKLETDKRHIRRRIQSIKKELDGVERRRALQHNRRKKNGVFSVAVVGYTNAGKSTLMNTLTNAGVLQEDKLFATLDPTARKLTLPDGRQIMLIDTVGFISRLPHQLVDAFRSTLEEAVYADVILNICDASDSECLNHTKISEEILKSLFDGGIVTVPVITVFNKCDIARDINKFGSNDAVRISAKTGEGIDELLLAVEKALVQTRKRVRLLIPFDKGSLVSKVRENGEVYHEEYTENGAVIEAAVDISVLGALSEYII
ncbi:MAG: GTPase HflX [Clostridiales bacterium]|nr:GTPase HflX [Clostridiales bacterium]